MHDATATMHPAPAQHMQALQRATAVRVARAGLKRDVEKGAASVGEVILNPPWEAASMTIAELLTSQRNWGSTRSRKFLVGLGMPETKTVASMTERQRSLLATSLSEVSRPVESWAGRAG
ncbi:MAG: hypothetical protein LC790_14505 [Actinobacteria bacterium]|nr:hypothetical protein [Actinomycetota bacterium]